MKRHALKTVLAMASIFAIMILFFGSSRNLLAEESHITVTLKSGEVQKLAADSFEIEWNFPITFLEEETCVRRVVEEKDVKFIFPINKAHNSCENKEDWLFEVDFWNDNYVQGFVISKANAKKKLKYNDPQVTGSAINGTIVETGKKVTISYKDIRKISFPRKK